MPLKHAVHSIIRTLTFMSRLRHTQGIQLSQLTGPDANIAICHSGQAQRSAGFSSFGARARVWEIPVFRCAETGMTVLMQAGAVVTRSG